MKFILKTLVIGLLAWGTQQFLPFWSVAAVGFATSALIKTKSHTAFFAGFWGIFLLWFTKAYFIDQQTNSILTNRIGELFSLSPMLLPFITALLGGLIGGISSSSGHYFRELFERKRNIYHR